MIGTSTKYSQAPSKNRSRKIIIVTPEVNIAEMLVAVMMSAFLMENPFLVPRINRFVTAHPVKLRITNTPAAYKPKYTSS